MSSVHIKTQSQRLQIPVLEERFRKAPFSWRISVDGNLTVEIKLRFQISPAYFVFDETNYKTTTDVFKWRLRTLGVVSMLVCFQQNREETFARVPYLLLFSK